MGVTQPLPRIGTELDEDAALRAACALLDQRNWSAARHAFHALAARVPQSKRYRALLCYSRGREAHEAGRGEEALIEYQRALQLEPDLSHVKQAVAELQRRR
jgi:tetratricopeptide (TPR) repeat protein